MVRCLIEMTWAMVVDEKWREEVRDGWWLCGWLDESYYVSVIGDGRMGERRREQSK